MLHPTDIVLDHTKKYCPYCEREHAIFTVLSPCRAKYKGRQINYTEMLDFCEHTETYMETQDQRHLNNIAQEEAYFVELRQ